MARARIFNKLFLSHASIGLLSILAFSFIFYYAMRRTIITRTTSQLASVNTLMHQRLDDYFRQTQSNIGFLFTHDFFTEHFTQTSLTPENFPPEVKREIRAIGQLHDFRQIVVVNSTNVVVYTTEGDAAPIERLLREDIVNTYQEKFTIVDASGKLSDRGVALVYLAPLEVNNIQIGTIAILDNFAKVQNLLEETSGLGSTGESYLVGPDKRMRSASKFLPEKNPLEIVVTGHGTGDSIANANDHVTTDYRGVKVISFASNIAPPSLAWSIVSEVDFAEAMQPVDSLRNYLAVVTGIMMVVVLGITAIISRAISQPIMKLKTVIMTMSRGTVPTGNITVTNKDEIGDIAQAIRQLIGSMKQTADFAYAIGAGQFDAQYALLSEQDVIGMALIHMRDRLKTLHDTEIRLIREKTAALLEGQENERKRITRELHDGVGQLLTAVRLQVQLIENNPGLKMEIAQLVNETIEEVRRISYNLMPNTIVDFGLEAAMRSLCENVSNLRRKTKSLSIHGDESDANLPVLNIDLQYVRDTDGALAFDVGIALFRIAQEGLNNIVKHSGAKNIQLHVIEGADEVYLMLSDDGAGFDATRTHTGFGLRSMAERSKLLGGTFEIESTRDGGTVLEVHIPLSWGINYE